jgi:hypothetical protein
MYEEHYKKGRDPLTMGYLDNLDNKSPNKYEKSFKIVKITIVN